MSRRWKLLFGVVVVPWIANLVASVFGPDQWQNAIVAGVLTGSIVFSFSEGTRREHRQRSQRDSSAGAAASPGGAAGVAYTFPAIGTNYFSGTITVNSGPASGPATSPGLDETMLVGGVSTPLIGIKLLIVDIQSGRLFSTRRNTPYTPEPTRARHVGGEPRPYVGHVHVPMRGCTCGFYAMYPAMRHLAGMTNQWTVVKGWGRVILGEYGFKAEWMQVAAIVDLGGRDPGLEANTTARVAAVWKRMAAVWKRVAGFYDVPLITSIDEYKAFLDQWREP